MSVITMSREVGSGGDEVARRVCDLLGYSYFDKGLMAQAAQAVALTDAEMADFSEDSYRLKGFLEALVSRAAAVSTVGALVFGTHPDIVPEAPRLDDETAARLVAVTIRSLYQRGRFLVVGRGGQAILRGEPNVLHVRIVAGREDRIPRIMEAYGLSRLEAIDFMNERDQATRQYLKRFHNIEWTDPLLYHMILNTSLLGLEETAHLIATAAQRMDAQSSG